MNSCQRLMVWKVNIDSIHNYPHRAGLLLTIKCKVFNVRAIRYRRWLINSGLAVSDVTASNYYSAQRPWVRFWGAKNVPSSCKYLRHACVIKAVAASMGYQGYPWISRIFQCFRIRQHIVTKSGDTLWILSSVVLYMIQCADLRTGV